MSKLSTVYHVGRLDQPKRSGSFSYEGSGLSVSLHPDAWRRIARGQVSGDTWVLKKAKPKFLLATKTNKEKAVEWAVKNGWIDEAMRYRVSWFDDEMSDTMSTEFDSFEEAQVEAEDRGVEPEAVKSYVLAKKGIDYWRQAFQSEPDNSMAAEFAILWFAEERGYDGVWWNDKLDPNRLSAPRGVIFQSKLGEWSKQKIDGEASVSGSASRLYRRVTDDHYTGAGSFWSDDPLVAEKYGPRGGQTISTELSGRVLVVDSDIELEAKLVELGIENAAELLLESEWHEDEDVLKALRDEGYVWVSRPVDPSVSRTEREFVRVAEGSALKAASALEHIYYRTADGRAHVLIGNAASFADEDGAAADLKYESGLVAYVSDIESLGLAKGQGTRLMQHVLTDLRKRGVVTVALQPIGYTRRGGTFDYVEHGDPGHDRLVRFYEKFGFKIRMGAQPFNNPLMYLSLGATVSAAAKLEKTLKASAVSVAKDSTLRTATLPAGSEIFHGTLEDFSDDLRPGGYDKVAWFADMPAIAQLYIPRSGGTTYADARGLRYPSQQSSTQEIQKAIGIEYDISKVKWDRHGRPDSFPSPKGMDDIPSEQEIESRLQQKGWNPKEHGIYAFRFDGSRLMKPDEKQQGRLFVGVTKRPMKLWLKSKGESDLQDLQYHDLSGFEAAKAIGLDGVLIDDFAQSESYGNFGHISVGIFGPALKDIQFKAVPATYEEWDYKNKGATEAWPHTGNVRFHKLTSAKPMLDVTTQVKASADPDVAKGQLTKSSVQRKGAKDQGLVARRDDYDYAYNQLHSKLEASESLEVYSGEGEYGTGSQIVVSLDDEPIGHIDVYGSPQSLNEYLQRDYVKFTALPKGRVGYLGGIELPEELRGKGTGRRAVDLLLKEAKRHDLSGVALLSTQSAVGFWERMGWSEAPAESDDSFNIPMFRPFRKSLKASAKPLGLDVSASTVEAVHYTDIYPAGFTAFRKKYLPLLKQSDHRYLYVQFTNFAADSLSRNPHKDPDHHDPIGVYGYPLAYVLKHPADIWYGSKAKFLRVLRERKRNKTLFLQGLSHSEASSILWKMGLDSNDMDKAKLLWPDRIGNTKNSVAKAMFTVIQMDLSSVVVPRNKDRRREVAKGVRIRSGVEQTALLRKAGFDAVEDTAGTNKGAVINDREPEQIIFLHRHAFDVVETVQLRGDVNSRGVGTTQELGIAALKLAVLLAQAMNDRIVDKEVNYSGVQVWTAGGREIQVSLDRPDSYYKNKKMGEKKHKESKLASPYMVKTTVTTERGVFHPGRGYASIPFQEIADDFAREFAAAEPEEGFVPVTRAKREAEKKAAEAAWRAKERSKEDQERERYAPGWLASIAEASAMLGVPFQHADLWNKDAESRKALQTVMRVVGRGFSEAYTLAKRAANEQNDWKWSNYFDKSKAEEAFGKARFFISEGVVYANPAALEELLALYQAALDWMLSKGTWSYQHPDAFWAFLVRDMAEKPDV